MDDPVPVHTKTETRVSTMDGAVAADRYIELERAEAERLERGGVVRILDLPADYPALRDMASAASDAVPQDPPNWKKSSLYRYLDTHGEAAQPDDEGSGDGPEDN